MRKRGLIYVGILYLLFNALYCFPSFAEDWEVYVPDASETYDQVHPIAGYVDPEDWEEYDIASASDATSSNAVRSSPDVAPFSSHVPYDSSISTSVIQYMSDVLPKIGNTSYVLFRSGQYTYHLIYADDLAFSGSVFSSPGVSYILYDSRDYTWVTGTENAFTLRTNGYIVYSDLGNYPVLARDSLYIWGLMFLGAVFFLFTIFRSFFSPGRIVI